MSDEPIQMTLTGDRDIVAAFKDLREYLPKNALRTAVRKSSEFLLRMIVLAAPKLTGKLARNIIVKTKMTAHTIRARVAVNTIGKAGDDQNAFYWRFLEEGFHTRRGDFRQYPFIAGIVETYNRDAAQNVIDACEEAIDRAEAKAKRAGA